MSSGLYHWSLNEEKLFSRVKEFMVNNLHLSEPSDKEVWLTILIIMPAKGIDSKENHKFFVRYSQEELEVYRNIFISNNTSLVDKFFKSTLIRQLWPEIVRHSTLALYFKSMKPNIKLYATYCRITSVMRTKYELEVPRFWADKFSN